MARELGIEQHFIRRCAEVGWGQKKEGQDGWPDRQVFWAPGRHFWVELKNDEGSLTRAQKVRFKLLRAAGEVIFMPRNRREVDELFEVLQ